MQSCPAPLLILNKSITARPLLTLACWPEYRFLRSQVRWSGMHLFKNFPQFAVIHTIKDFSIVSEAEVDFFPFNSLAFCMIQQMLAIWSLVSLPCLKPAGTSGSSRFMYCWRLAWRILSITLWACEMSPFNLAPTICLFLSILSTTFKDRLFFKCSWSIVDL